eukprot:Sdes_comp16566_c0_seq1m5877
MKKSRFTMVSSSKPSPSPSPKSRDGEGIPSANSESLAQLFNCFICLTTLSRAHMCPYCSKMCCEACFKKWLTEQKEQCPHCRCNLTTTELINCRWVAEVTKCLDEIQIKSPKSSCSSSILLSPHKWRGKSKGNP